MSDERKDRMARLSSLRSVRVPGIPGEAATLHESARGWGSPSAGQGIHQDLHILNTCIKATVHIAVMGVNFQVPSHPLRLSLLTSSIQEAHPCRP